MKEPEAPGTGRAFHTEGGAGHSCRCCRHSAVLRASKVVRVVLDVVDEFLAGKAGIIVA